MVWGPLGGRCSWRQEPMAVVVRGTALIGWGGQKHLKI